jgi:hypothetical protein
MKLWILFLLLTFVLTCTVFGQTTGSSQAVGAKVVLTGTVYDINGSVIPVSHLVARSFAGKEYQATTSDEGIYKIELPLDVYKIEVNAPGFCPKRVEMFRVRNSPLVQRPLDFVLEISEGDRPCKQKTMIKKEPQIRQPEIFRSIAE